MGGWGLIQGEFSMTSWLWHCTERSLWCGVLYDFLTYWGAFRVLIDGPTRWRRVEG